MPRFIILLIMLEFFYKDIQLVWCVLFCSQNASKPLQDGLS